MDFSFDLDRAQVQRRTYIVSPRPRNLFGHVFMPAATRKKYVFAATPRNFVSKKMKKDVHPPEDDFFNVTEHNPYPALRSPRPVRRTPYEVRKSMEIDPLSKIDIKAAAREVKEMNKWNERRNNVEVPPNIAEVFLVPSYAPDTKITEPSS